MKTIGLRRPPTGNQGFTLLEIIIVVSLIVILAAASVRYYTGYLNRSKCSALEYAAQQTMLRAVRYVAERGPQAGITPADLDVNASSFQMVQAITIGGNGTSSNPLVVNATSTGQCPQGSKFILQEGQPTGTWK